MDWTNELQQLRKSDTDIGLIMQVYEEAAKVHGEALAAMGQQVSGAPSPVVSTKVTFNVDSDLSSKVLLDKWNTQITPKM